MRILCGAIAAIFLSSAAAAAQPAPVPTKSAPAVTKPAPAVTKPATPQTPAAPAEDCAVVDPAAVKASNVGGIWKVTLGANETLDFAQNEAAAERAVDVIQHYHFTRECFAKRPNAPMMYWRNGVAVPPGDMPGEDCIAVHPEAVAAVDVAARWKVMDGTLWLLDYGVDRAAADEAVRIIRTYNLNRECFIARPRVVMQYWLAE